MLFVVGTPIGNLKDLSFRQVETLLSSDIILAEDTRSAGILLNLLTKEPYNKLSYPQLSKSMKPKLISYYKDNEFEKLPEVLMWLREGKKISLISESGMPLISDPGLSLIKHLIKERMTFEVIPGPTAITTALIYSGMNPNNFVFMGFFPKKLSHALQYINTLKCVNKCQPSTTFVFYESPNRINKTLEILNREIPHAEIAICRELTKKFEEIIRGKPRDLLDRVYKGEITLVVRPL